MTQTKSASLIAGMKAGIRARRRARRHPKAWPVKYIAFVACCIRDLDDPVERAAATADFAAVHFMTAGLFDQGHTQFGRVKFIAPTRADVVAA
jgi:hypothetical protein